MASPYTPPVQILIDELGRLPGIGPRSAQRLALHLIKSNDDDVARLARSIIEAKQKVRFCERCFNLADSQLCSICADAKRESTILCVVEDSRDIAALERTGGFRGRYHVLLGLIDPLQGVSPENLKVRELVARIKPEGITEVVVCTSNNTEGDVTAMYLARMLSPLGVEVSRLASGLPVGGDIEFADEVTLGRAFDNRRRLEP
ncbi:MAG: recombination mediator RecR [Acidimicrobiaceae bacterium]|nr:recombination mediator RecR [Ilumatobacteraceae bacterium]